MWHFDPGQRSVRQMPLFKETWYSEKHNGRWNLNSRMLLKGTVSKTSSFIVQAYMIIKYSKKGNEKNKQTYDYLGEPIKNNPQSIQAEIKYC